MKDENLQRMQMCTRFNRCSSNVCPLDSETQERTYFTGEEGCPFTIKRRKRFQKGVMTRAPDHLLKVIPESNFKMLNSGNQKRWHALYKGRTIID